MKKYSRKGFTLVELLIVIAIMGTLAAMMSTSSGSASAVAKASAIYSNIRSIKAAALLYQAEQGEDFHEDQVTEANLKKFVDLQIYRKFSNGTNDSTDDVRYAIVKGTLGDGNVLEDGAYVVVNFDNDGDREAIATALSKYKNMRVTADKTKGYFVGAFLYHVTPESTAKDAPYEYNVNFYDFTFPNITK